MIQAQQRQFFACQRDVARERDRLWAFGKAGQGVGGEVLRVEQQHLAAKLFGVNAEALPAGAG